MEEGVHDTGLSWDSGFNAQVKYQEGQLFEALENEFKMIFGIEIKHKV